MNFNLIFDKHFIKNLEYQFLKDSKEVGDEDINMNVDVQHSTYIHKKFQRVFLECDIDIILENSEEEFRTLKATINFFYDIKSDEDFDLLKENNKAELIKNLVDKKIVIDVYSKLRDIIRNFTLLDYNGPLIIASPNISEKDGVEDIYYDEY